MHFVSCFKSAYFKTRTFYKCKKTHVHVAKKCKNNRNKYDVIWLISVAGSVFCPRQGVGGAFLGATAFGKKL